MPRSCFSGPDARPVRSEQERYGKLIRERYPWLTQNSVEVMFRKAREVMKATLDEETGGMSTSAVLARKGDLEGAAAALRKHLEDDPEDADAWYRLGELLCRAGRTDEGYAAFREGRKHFRTGP